MSAWILVPVWCVIPEIAKKIWNSILEGGGEWVGEEGLRGQWQGEEKGEEAEEGGRWTGNWWSRLPPFPPPPQKKLALLCLLSPLLLLTPTPLSLCYIQALDYFPVWLSSGYLVVLHDTQHFLDILRTFYPNTVPLELVDEAGGGVCKESRLNHHQGVHLGRGPSAKCLPHSFSHSNGNSFVWSCFSPKSWCLNGEEIWSHLAAFLQGSVSQGKGDPLQSYLK